MRWGLALVGVGLAAGTARAETTTELYERLYPADPVSTQLSLSQNLLEQLSVLGNTVGFHMGVLSHDLVGLEVDARGRRARVHVGGGDARYLTFELASNVYFVGGQAQVVTQIDFGIAGRSVHLELPEVDMVPTEFHGERGVEVRLPLYRRTF